MKLAQRRPEYYDVEEFGVPVNDLDCVCHAILGFYISNGRLDCYDRYVQRYSDMVEFSSTRHLAEGKFYTHLRSNIALKSPGPGDQRLHSLVSLRCLPDRHS